MPQEQLIQVAKRSSKRSCKFKSFVASPPADQAYILGGGVRDLCEYVREVVPEMSGHPGFLPIHRGGLTMCRGPADRAALVWLMEQGAIVGVQTAGHSSGQKCPQGMVVPGRDAAGP